MRLVNRTRMGYMSQLRVQARWRWRRGSLEQPCQISGWMVARALTTDKGPLAVLSSWVPDWPVPRVMKRLQPNPMSHKIITPAILTMDMIAQVRATHLSMASLPKPVPCLDFSIMLVEGKEAVP